MYPQPPDWTFIRLHVDPQGCCLKAEGRDDVLAAISPERRALFETLIRLAFRGRTSQFRLVGFGPLKGRCWEWTVQPFRENGPVVAAELICRQTPPLSPFGPRFTEPQTTSDEGSAPAPLSSVPAWLPS